MKLPGLIDVHAHLREPGAMQKEDFASGTRAAVKGGFTFVVDMPNNPIPTLSLDRLEEKIARADRHALCDVGFYFGTDGKNLASFEKAAAHPRVFGLKVYCNHTTGKLFVENREVIEEIFRSWESSKPILVHAEGMQLAIALELAEKYKRRLHECHISLACEVELLRAAKRKGLVVSGGVTPHHLFLTSAAEKELGVKALMKPPLATETDQRALWEGLREGTIDLVETDHAPHLLSEKQEGMVKFGVPGLETALGLLGKAVEENRLSVEEIKKFLYDNPKRLFKIPDQPGTHIEVNFEKYAVVRGADLESKAKWSPFEGWELPGVVETVVLRGKTLMEKGKLAV